MKKILAISGSLRAKSTNQTIVENVGKLLCDRANLEIYDGIGKLPIFNPDLDTDSPPSEIVDLRRQIREADGVLITSPEYVFSLPAALKNVLEWTVSSSDFSGKPTALITVSSLGEKAHESLFLVLKTIEAKISKKTSLLISGARTKVNSEGEINDDATLASLEMVITSLLQIINE